MIPAPHDLVIIAAFGLAAILELCAIRLGCEWWWGR